MEQHSHLGSGTGICKIRQIRTPRAKHAVTDRNRGTGVVVPLIPMLSLSDGDCSGISPEVYTQVVGKSFIFQIPYIYSCSIFENPKSCDMQIICAIPWEFS